MKLRADNADQRLTPLGLSVGCVGEKRRSQFEAKMAVLRDGQDLLARLSLTPNEAEQHGIRLNKDGRRRSAFDLLSLAEITIKRLEPIWPELSRLDGKIARQLAVDARYSAYVRRQEEDVAAGLDPEAGAERGHQVEADPP